MPDWFFDRSTVIALAIVGGVFSILASWSQARGWVTEKQFTLLSQASYVFMAISIILFICVGLFGMGDQAA